MSVISPQKLSLDFNKNEVKIIGINQYDVNSRSVEITCTEDGVPVILDKTKYTAQLKLMTSKNNMFLNRDCCTIQNDGTILVTFEDSMMYDAGKAAAQILITGVTNEGDGEVLSTVQFGVVVRDSVFDDEEYIHDYDKYSELSELMAELKTALERAETAARNSEISANESSASASSSSTYATNSSNSATLSQSWAEGGTNTRSGEDTNNSKYWSEKSSDYSDDAHGWCDNKGDSGSDQYSVTNNAFYYMKLARQTAQALNGALLPMGEITFAELPTPVTTGDLKNTGFMYDITDAFTTTSLFREGAGIHVNPISKVYITPDGKYSILSTSSIVGFNIGVQDTSLVINF